MLSRYYSTSGANFIKACKSKLFKTITSLVLGILLFAAIPSLALAAVGDETTTGSLTLFPTIECIGVTAVYTGDNNLNNSAVLQYRVSPSGTWKTAPEMYADRSTKQFRGSIFWLNANTTYEVRVTFADADTVSGTNPVTGSTTTRNDNPAIGTNYLYIATTGSDTTGDGTIGNPWRTIQKAAGVVNPGNTVLVRAGTYNESVTITRSGTAGSYITFMPYGSEVVTLNGNNSLTNTFYVNGADYIRIKGFNTTTYTGTSIYINNSDYAIVENCNITNPNTAGTGIQGGVRMSAGTNNALIQYNTVTVNVGPVNTITAITFWQPGYGLVIRYNTVTGTAGGLGPLRDGIGGGQENVAGQWSNNDIYGNIISGAADDAIQAEGDGVNVRIWNNITDDSFIGIAFCPVMKGPTYIFRNTITRSYNYKMGDESAGYGRVYLYHNSFYNGQAGDGYKQTNGYLGNIVSRNNIIYSGRYVFELKDNSAPETLDFDYDSMYTTDSARFVSWTIVKYPNLTAFQTGTNQELHGISVSDVKFTNAAGGDLTLQPISPCIDAGVIIPGFNDADSPWPFNGSAPDMGAYESAPVAPVPPVLASIGNKPAHPGMQLQFTISATDPNGDALTYSASNTPAGAVFTPATRTFAWTPTANQTGSYPGVRFTVTDGTFTDFEDITITVAPNQAPVLTNPGNKTVNENAALTFTVSAADPDGDTLTYSASNIPSGSTFTPSTRTFSWTPSYTQAGTYANVSFSVTDGALTDSENITITVNNVNRPPVLGNIGNKTVTAGQLLQFTVSATDPDGNPLTYSVSNLPSGATFTPSTRTFSWTPSANQTGSYSNVRFQVSDGSLTDYENISITVTVAANQAPVLTNPGNKSVNEGATLTFTISATDANRDSLTYSASNIPSGATFTPATRTFSWTPSYSQVGTYANVRFSVTDSVLGDSETITITVNNVNRAPVLGSIGNKSVKEWQLLTFTISATDPDGNPLTYSASNLPSGATFSPSTRTFSWKPSYSQAGTYANVRFSVTNGVLGDSETITITVNNVNRAPVLGNIGNKTVTAGQLLQFTVSATDPDGNPLTYSASNLPSGATFTPSTRTFSWTPSYSQAGTYANVRFQVSDWSLIDFENITITVTPN
jgi:hypothetical protein